MSETWTSFPIDIIKIFPAEKGPVGPRSSGLPTLKRWQAWWDKRYLSVKSGYLSVRFLYKLQMLVDASTSIEYCTNLLHVFLTNTRAGFIDLLNTALVFGLLPNVSYISDESTAAFPLPRPSRLSLLKMNWASVLIRQILIRTLNYLTLGQDHLVLNKPHKLINLIIASFLTSCDIICNPV